MSDLFSRAGSYRLTPEQVLLLQAVLLEGSAALTAWEQWQSLVDIEVLDNNSHVLLPQLYQSLLAHGVENLQMARLKGIYRRNWYANQLQLKQLKVVLSHLKNVGIEAIVLGNAASSSDQVENYRSISDFHLLIRAAEIEEASQHLTSFNWHIAHPLASTSRHLQNAQRQSLYLQGHLFWAIPQDDTDQKVWQYATPSGDDLAGWRLSPTDQFLERCAGTFFKSKSSQISGVADALMIVQQVGDALDWTRLVTQAQRYQMILPVRNMLILWQQVLQLAAPSWVLPALCQMPIAQAEWLNYQLLAGDWKSGWRSTCAQSIHPLTQFGIQLRYHPFPGRRVLKNLLKPTKSALEVGE